MKNFKTFKWSALYIKQFIPTVICLLLWSTFVNYFSTFEPMFTGKIIDALTIKDKGQFFFYLKVIVLFQVGSLLLSLISSVFQYFLQRRLTVYTEGKFYINLLHIPAKSNKESGKILNLFLSDLATMVSIFTSQLPSIIISIIMMCVLGFRLFKIDSLLFVMTLAVSIIPIFLARYFGKKQALINKEQREKQDKYTLITLWNLCLVYPLFNSINLKAFL